MKNKEIYKYLMHMEEVIYDLKRSIDRTRKPKDKDEELWERVKNAAPGEWVCIDPESHVSGFIRYARDAGDIMLQEAVADGKGYYAASTESKVMHQDPTLPHSFKLFNNGEPMFADANDLPIELSGKARTIPPKRTMKDVNVGDKVMYVTPMPEGTWMGEPWGDKDGLNIGDTYEVKSTIIGSQGRHPVICVVGTEFCFDIDINCFELI